MKRCILLHLDLHLLPHLRTSTPASTSSRACTPTSSNPQIRYARCEILANVATKCGCGIEGCGRWVRARLARCGGFCVSMSGRHGRLPGPRARSILCSLSSRHDRFLWDRCRLFTMAVQRAADVRSSRRQRISRGLRSKDVHLGIGSKGPGTKSVKLMQRDPRT